MASGIQQAHNAKAIHTQRPISLQQSGPEMSSTGDSPAALAEQRRAQATTHRIVMLESMHIRLPEFSIPATVTEHRRTGPEEVLPRLRDATIGVSIMTPITPAVAAQCPALQLIVVMATGTSWVERDTLAALGITVIHCPHSNISAVSEHALGLYFAVRKRIPQLHALTTGSDAWAERGTLTACWDAGPPLSCSEEVVGIVGFGAVGRAVAELMRGVGMGEVLVAERKGAERTREGRVAFEEAVRRASVLVLCCPEGPSTENLIDEQRLKDMRQECVVINLARGGIVNEHALAKALRERWISGAATDVTSPEPGRRGENPLLPADGQEAVPNFVISPHVAWFTSRTLVTLRQLAKDGIEGYLAGTPINVIVDPLKG